uniref:Macrophage migration inhibitory factor n=1 Tax=Panagrolaimus sp. JU765 TaxID=591449 RepID=A0AC34QJS9_9BILA
MPFVTFTTNVPEDKLGQNFNQKLNKGLAEAIPEKPYELFAIHVISTDKFTFGGTNEPAAMIQITAFGIYTPQSCKKYSKSIGEFLQKEVGLSPTRVLIQFADLPATHCGFNLTTCDEL